ncbi:CapA family protein [Candidatus Shapirobacteria bacterium]|nr:CapA family protein [Candidatus Shapirobacteria bacterium]
MHHWPIFLIILCFLVFLPYSYFLNLKSNILSPIVYQNSTPTLLPTPTLPLPVTVGFVGDLGLGRHITSTARTKKDFSWSFQGISSWLVQNDFTVANLESPIIKNCPKGETGTFTFCGDPQFLPYLQSNKFILNLNNNHILNYSLDGLNQTRQFLPDTNFYDNFLIKKVNGISFGFLGYDFITYPKTDTAEILNKIKSVRSNVDYLIISIHWGNEYLPQAEKWRVELAHQMIDAGADIIHGHHPHVWQGVETYKDKLIFYSFGNFIFDQSWSYETSHSQIAQVTFQTSEPLTYKLFPIEIKFNSQPWLMP